MDQSIEALIEPAAIGIELVGVTIIVLFVAISTIRALIDLVRRRPGLEISRDARHRLASGILLGLEFLVAADIIHTVAVDLTFGTVGVLAIIVLVRTFLSYSLEVELSGRWPWQRDPAA